MAATRRIQFMCRIDTTEESVLRKVAEEQNFFGGQGVRKGEPNLSRAARFLWAKGDKRMAAAMKGKDQ